MEDRLPMLRGRRWTLILVGVVVLFLGIVASVQCRDFVSEVIPRRALVTPVLVMDVDLNVGKPQAHSFSLKYSGSYSVNAQLKLRHGPKGMPAKAREFVLAGRAEIFDEADSEIAVEREFERVLLEYEVGTKSFEFDSDEVGLEGDKSIRIAVRVTPEFREHYSDMKVFIKKEMKYPIVD